MAVPSKASTAANKMFCDCQPRVLKASVAPTAVPLLSVIAVLVAAIVASLLASTARFLPTTNTLSSARAWTWLRIRLTAIRPLAAIAPPPATGALAGGVSEVGVTGLAADAAGSAAATVSVLAGAPGLVPAFDVEPVGAGPLAAPSSWLARTSPLSVATIAVDETALTLRSSTVLTVKPINWPSTSLRTSLRTTMPPTDTLLPPAPDETADMLTSAVMLAASSASTSSPAPRLSA